jgi:hypothetical protein
MWRLAAGILLAFFLCPPSAWGCSCGLGALLVFPPPGEANLAPDGKLIVDGYGAQSAVILPEHPLGLVGAKGDEIPLRIVKTYSGASGRRAVVYAPERRLSVATSYRLVAMQNSRQPRIELNFQNGRSDLKGKAEWQVAKPASQLAIRSPAVIECRAICDECGVHSSISIRVAVHDNGYALVRPVGGAESAEAYPVVVSDGVLRLDDGPCNSAFSLVPGRTYTLEIRALNSVTLEANEQAVLVTVRVPVAEVDRTCNVSKLDEGGEKRE